MTVSSWVLLGMAVFWTVTGMLLGAYIRGNSDKQRFARYRQQLGKAIEQRDLAVEAMRDAARERNQAIAQRDEIRRRYLELTNPHRDQRRGGLYAIDGGSG